MTQPKDQRRRRNDPSSQENLTPPYTPRLYQSPRLVVHGSLGELIRGASWKGMDSIGELDPDQAYPG